MSDIRRSLMSLGNSGDSCQEVSGTVVGNGTLDLPVECSFEPDVAYIRRIEPSTALTYRSCAGIMVLKSVGQVMYQCNANTTDVGTYNGTILTNERTTTNPFFSSSYSNGVFTFGAANGGREFSAAVTYEYHLVKYT